MNKIKYKKPTLLNPGHTACAGCGQLLVASHVMDALGSNTIVVNATGCLEVTTTKFGESAWGVPYIHSLFENASAVASGIFAAQKFLNNPNKPNIAVLAGDGATFDIGFGLLSGMFERGDNILYICFDNEGYQNTGAQASGSSPLGTDTTTTPYGAKSLGALQTKKNMVAFAVGAGAVYVATSTAAYPKDIKAKITEALKHEGPKYIQILVPCVPGWGSEPNKTVEVARLAATTGFYPILEIIEGKITKVLKTSAQKPRVEEYLKLQKRYQHLFKDPNGKKIIEQLQSICDQNILSYGLCPTCEEHEILMQYRGM